MPARLEEPSESSWVSCYTCGRDGIRWESAEETRVAGILVGYLCAGCAEQQQTSAERQETDLDT